MRVEPETIVAQAFIPGRPHLVAVSNQLNIEPSEFDEVMVKSVGDSVREGEVIARYSAFFGLFRGQCQSPATGTIEHISSVTGQVTIREPAAPVAVKAYISGTVTEVLPREGVVVETPAALIQGIFGIGGEGCGTLRIAVKKPTDTLTARQILDGDRGRILVGGVWSPPTPCSGPAKLAWWVWSAAASWTGTSMNTWAMKSGGHHRPRGHSLSLVVTEGFGKIPMAEKTFALFQKLAGETASINGTTQIRADCVPKWCGAARRSSGPGRGRRHRAGNRDPGPGNPHPWFSRLGAVSALPVQLQKIESEAKVRVLEVTLIPASGHAPGQCRDISGIRNGELTQAPSICLAISRSYQLNICKISNMYCRRKTSRV